jgi:hypothetical protein
MKEEVEEPFRKNGRTLFILVLLLLLLLVTGVLLVSWYVGDIRQGAETADLKRIIISFLAVLTLIVLLMVLLINLLRKHKKTAKKTSPVKRLTSHTGTHEKPGIKKRPVSKRRM